MVTKTVNLFQDGTIELINYFSMIRKFLALFTIALLPLSAIAQTDLIAPTLTGTDLIQHIETNYAVTNSQSYSAARDAMFENIDGPSGMITCVYTGFTISFTDRQDAQGSQSANDFNTEHIWPQSFFNQDSPMRSDIHHLYPTRVDVNGARSNFPFAEINDNQTTTWYRDGSNQSSIPVSNIDEYSELLSGTSFEPREDHKGNVARAIFYFWTVYQNNTSITTDNTDNAAFFNGMKDVLLTWHELDPVDQTEVDRSIAIESVQGNRNPFIHDTTLVRRAYFGGLPVSNELQNENRPTSFQLHQNYPNPFNPRSNITFDLPESGMVKIDVYNILGKRVSTLVDQVYSEGSHTIQFNAESFPSGIYSYIMQFNNQVQIRRMTLIK